ncbi:hypothetical protein A5782_17815 [Mycobacterium sp. 852002-40037_SCH5390672]|nr:hypothetical protein A5782_17815 [Mycobacterium sp. 852002-40037_SCH5390672]
MPGVQAAECPCPREVLMPNDNASLPVARTAIRAFREREGSEYDQSGAHGISSGPERRRWASVVESELFSV